MITAIVMAAVFITLVLVLYLSDRTASKPNGNMLLGVTLPYDALKDGGVSDIVGRYKKAYSLVCLAFLLLTVPLAGTE